MTTPDQPTGMNELREILAQHYFNTCNPALGQSKILEARAEAEAAIQQLVERCLGPDENEGDPKDPNISDAYFYQQQRRNSLRAEIRHNFQQAGLLRGEDVTK